MKKKENRNAGSNPDLLYPYLSPFNYTFTTAKTRQNSEKFNKLFFLTYTSITGDPSLFQNF